MNAREAHFSRCKRLAWFWSRFFPGVFTSAFLASVLISGPSLAQENSAAILAYQNVADEGNDSTRISVAQFEAHLREIVSGGYHVLPLSDILSKIKRGEGLRPRTLAITIDQASLSAYRVAWPRLKQAKLPFTLFVSTRPLDKADGAYMSWANLREMAADPLVTIASQSADTQNLAGLSDKEMKLLIDEAVIRLGTETGKRPDLFAYPNGVMSAALFDILAKRGYRGAFGRHSGPVSEYENKFALPRFPINMNYGDLSRLRMAANSLPFPAIERSPRDPFLPGQAKAGVNPPSFGFSLANAAFSTKGLACYASGIEKALELWRPVPERVEVIFKAPFVPGTTRINCTMPTGNNRWRWLGAAFYVPGVDAQ